PWATTRGLGNYPWAWSVPPTERIASMKTGRIDIGSIRRQQIVEAAVAVITEQGLDNLSLSKIEEKAGMSRGQLTYYFHSREDILLAVFDRLLELMCQQAHLSQGGVSPCSAGSGWERIQRGLTHVLLHPSPRAEFHALQYTFLSQIAHREDFRQ